MKLSIKILAIVAVFVSLNLTASAQRGDKTITPEQRAEKTTERMTEQLNLEANQVAQVKALNMKHAAKTKAIKDANKGNREASKAEMKALRDDHKLALQEILTDEQFTKFEKNAKRKKGGKHSKRKSKRSK